MNDTYNQGYKFKLYPNEEQKVLINKYINLYRYVYNWALNKEKEHYQEKKDDKTEYGFYTFYDLCKLFVEYKDRPGNEWLKELPNTTARLALRDVVNTYNNFFKRGYGFPKFKSKKRSPKMFKTRNDRFFIDGDKVRFEGLLQTRGDISMKNGISLKYNTNYKRKDKVKYIMPCISIDNLGNYWLSFSIAKEKMILNTSKSEVIGIDVGIRNTLTLSNGIVYNKPNDKLNKLEKRRRRVQRHVSRDIQRRLMESKRTKTKYEDVPVSNRANKRSLKLRKLYKKITNIKNTWYHTTIKQIVLQNPEAIVIETTNTRSMQKANKKNCKKVRNDLAHSNFYTIAQIIEDKCNKYNVPLIKADRFYPSSQICSVCGHRQNIGSKHIYNCPICGNTMDRDLNAALNLRNLYYNAS